MTDRSEKSVGHALVTGAGGFIGSHLTGSLLHSGTQVTAFDLDLTTVRHHAAAQKCRLVEGSIADPAARTEALSGVDTVFHLAAAHLGALQPAEEFRQINVDATRSLAEDSILTGVRRFVHCSSVGVYGRIETPPADEETPCRPELPYEQTKLEGEKAILQLVEARQLPAVILRPVWVYGPGCHRTRKLFKTIAAKKFFVAGKGETFRHCIYIDDMVTAMIQAAAKSGVVGEIFVVGDDKPVTIRHLVDEIAKLTGSPSPPSLPFALVSTMATMTEVAFRALQREPPISRRSLRFFTGNTAFRTDKAKQMIDLSPHYDLSQGLAETHRRIADEL